MFAFSNALVWENNTGISDLTSDIMGLYVSDLTTFDFIVWPTELSLIWFYMDSLNKTRNTLYIKVHEAKKALIKDIGPGNRIHLTVLVSVGNIYILCIV